MLRRLIGWLCVALMGGVLAACGGASTTSPVETSGTSNNLPASVTSIPSTLYPQQDYALVANTGKPQFIHSFADW